MPVPGKVAGFLWERFTEGRVLERTEQVWMEQTQALECWLTKPQLALETYKSLRQVPSLFASKRKHNATIYTFPWKKGFQ